MKKIDKEELKSDFYIAKNHRTSHDKSKVNLNELVNRLNLEKKKERKNNIILTVAAVSAVSVFGVILTL